MRHRKDPTVAYHNEVCFERFPDYHVFGIHDDGVGNKRLALEMHIDKQKKTLHPASVYKVMSND